MIKLTRIDSEDDAYVSFHNFIIFLLLTGFKPGQRKVLFACLKRNLVKEMKVAQLAGSVAELSAYHHGEVDKKIFSA